MAERLRLKREFRITYQSDLNSDFRSPHTFSTRTDDLFKVLNRCQLRPLNMPGHTYRCGHPIMSVMDASASFRRSLPRFHAVKRSTSITSKREGLPWACPDISRWTYHGRFPPVVIIRWGRGRRDFRVPPEPRGATRAGELDSFFQHCCVLLIRFCSLFGSPVIPFDLGWWTSGLMAGLVSDARILYCRHFIKLKCVFLWWAIINWNHAARQGSITPFKLLDFLFVTKNLYHSSSINENTQRRK